MVMLSRKALYWCCGVATVTLLLYAFVVVYGYDVKDHDCGDGCTQVSSLSNLSLSASGDVHGLSLKDRILKNLKQCGVTMGVPPDTLRLHQTDGTLKNISRKAAVFLKRFWSVVPKQYSERFTTPCWYVNQTFVNELVETFHLHLHNEQLVTTHHYRRGLLSELKSISERRRALQCLPAFFLAGFSKCGTTTLNIILSHLTGIYPAEMKEIHWWGRGPLGRAGMSHEFHRHAAMMYLLNFFHASQVIENHKDFVTFDASPSTLVRSDFVYHGQEYCAMPMVMSSALPNAKFIVMLRDPTQRVYSHFFQICTTLSLDINKWPEDVKENPAGYFHRQVVLEIDHLKTCLANHSLFECVYSQKKQRSGCGNVGDKLSMGLYYIHIKKWLQFYPRNQFLFLRLEDLPNDPYTFLSKITKFLGIKSISLREAEVLGSVHSNRRVVQGAGENTELSMRQETRELLDEFYRPYNQLLANLLGDNQFLWQH